ncbi:MAG: DUF4956 domain-containing protein [Ruminococcus flavefaciens]|nr:DUF4956 domain-containing protein [Ruminococcus flavefaciens]
MSFSDIFTSDMLTRVTALSVTDMLIGIVLSFLIGMFIFFVYKKTFNGVLYSANFGLSLIGMCMIATVLIMAVSSNVVLSLGMVGALSIVRFRTAIKEPMDILFLFWAISTGIILATGMILLAVFGSIAIGAVLLIFANKNGKDQPYLLIVNMKDSETEKDVMKIVSENTEKNIIKSKTFSKNGNAELTIEVQLRENESSFVKSISNFEDIENVVMVSYNGDYMS